MGIHGRYDNFLGRTVVLQALTPGNPLDLFSGSTRRSISVADNSSGKVTTYGFGASIDYVLPHNWVASANISSDRIKDVPAGFVSFFDAPYLPADGRFGQYRVWLWKHVLGLISTCVTRMDSIMKVISGRAIFLVLPPWMHRSVTSFPCKNAS